MLAERNPQAEYWIFDDSFMERTIKVYLSNRGIKYVYCPTKRVDWKKEDTDFPYNKYVMGKNVKFDIVVGNPPYDKSLHLKILKETMKYVDFDNGGEIVWLHPDHWINNPFMDYNAKAIEREFAEQKTDLFSGLDLIAPNIANDLFGINAWNGICISNWKKTSNCIKASDFKTKNIIHHKVLPIIYKMPSLRSMFDKNITFKYSVAVRRTTHGNLPFADIHGSATQKIYFQTENELNNFIATNWMDSIFWTYLHKTWKCAENSAEFPWMGEAVNPRTGLKGYQGEWTDEDFFDYFKLTDEERELIVKTMK